MNKIQNTSPHDMPLYNIAEAAKYLGISYATLRSWVVGRSYPRSSGKAFFSPLILPQNSQNRMSFSNLIEAHVLWALRTKHHVHIKEVREALNFSQKKLGIERLLLSEKILTSDRDIFVERYGELINLSKSGQLALKKVLKDYLQRVEWKNSVPSRLYPFVANDDNKIILIDPLISFGKPVIEKKGISTSIIVNRIDAGESVDDLAADYDLTKSDIELAVVYERAA